MRPRQEVEVVGREPLQNERIKPGASSIVMEERARVV